MSHVSYLDRLIPSRFNATLEQLEAKIKEKFPKCNVLIGRGFSGAMIIPALAAKMNIHWALVRKEDNSHSSFKIELSCDRGEIREVIFIDDLICTGDTFRKTDEVLKKNHKVAIAGGIVYDGLIGDLGVPIYSLTHNY